MSNQTPDLLTALQNLVHQVEISNAVDDHGHALKNLQALEDARKAIAVYPTDDDPLASFELVKCGTFTEEAQRPHDTIQISKDLYAKLRAALETARAALVYVQGQVFESLTCNHDSAEDGSDDCGDIDDCLMHSVIEHCAEALRATDLHAAAQPDAKACSTSFINENGRQIDVEVGQTDEPGDVRFVIRGPHSESENICTRGEAAELHRLLGAHLGAQPDAEGRS
jgi:hypothetical protein